MDPLTATRIDDLEFSKILNWYDIFLLKSGYWQ